MIKSHLNLVRTRIGLRRADLRSDGADGTLKFVNCKIAHRHLIGLGKDVA